MFAHCRSSARVGQLDYQRGIAAFATGLLCEGHYGRPPEVFMSGGVIWHQWVWVNRVRGGDGDGAPTGVLGSGASMEGGVDAGEDVGSAKLGASTRSSAWAAMGPGSGRYGASARLRDSCSRARCQVRSEFGTSGYLRQARQARMSTT